MGFSSLLTKAHSTANYDKGEEYATQIQNAALEIANRLESLVESARLSRKDVSLDLDRYSLNSVLRTVDRDFKVRAKEKNLSLKLEAKIDREVVADLHRLRQAFGQILINAFEHCPINAVIAIDITDIENGIEVRFSYPFSEHDPVVTTCNTNFNEVSAGLFVAKRILDLHGAAFRAENVAGSTILAVQFAPGGVARKVHVA